MAIQNVFETMIYAQRQTKRFVALQAAGAVFFSIAASCLLSVFLANAHRRLLRSAR